MSDIDGLTPETLEAGRKLFAGQCDFISGVVDLHGLPPANKPEIAFAGRSNVGKSSLVNALTGRKTLARTSHTPGRTQQLNFFNLGERAYLVDMPGYGYAKVSKTMQAEWKSLIFSYLRGRPTLRCVFILVDSRHGLKDSDLELMQMLDSAAAPYRVILTKTDEVKRQDLIETREGVEAALSKHVAAFPVCHPTSAHGGMGIEELRAIAWMLTA